MNVHSAARIAKKVERRADKSVADLLKEMVGGNDKLVTVLTEIQKTIGADAKGGDVKPGELQLVTECNVASGVCSSVDPANVNAIIKGTCEHATARQRARAVVENAAG